MMRQPKNGTVYVVWYGYDDNNPVDCEVKIHRGFGSLYDPIIGTWYQDPSSTELVSASLGGKSIIDDLTEDQMVEIEDQAWDQFENE